jgi:hypothetical protein
MGVLWAIVALRLIFPFQIESKIGFLPDVGSKLEGFFYDITGSASSVTYHNYEPNTDDTVTYVYESEETATTETEAIERDYLPNEEIIVVEAAETTKGSSLWKRDLFVRLQMVWPFGLIVILAYAVFSYISIRRKTRAAIRLQGENDAFVCDEIDTPFILGVFRPTIYLPSGLDDETVKNVLAHEKAHIKRLDHLRKQLGFLLLAVYWFNPLVWVSYALFCKDIELACDERVIRHMSLDEKKSYANSLLLCSTHKRLVLAYPLAFGEVGVGTRVKQIFNYRKPTFWLLMVLVIVCVALSSSFFTSVSKDDTDGGSNVTDMSLLQEEVVSDFQQEESINITENEDTETHEYVVPNEEGSFYLPNATGDEGNLIDLKYASVSDYFDDVHEHFSMEDGFELAVDLDRDGYYESVVTEDLGYNGGDGGYLPHVYDGNGKEIAIPIDAESQPYGVLWGEDEVEIFQDDVCIVSLNWDEIKQIYLDKGYAETDFEEMKSHLEKDEWTRSDSASGFVVKDNGGKLELVVKFYIQGIGGHVDTLGYGLMHFVLGSDGKMTQTGSEFAVDM